ncbi:MAG: SRPBCC domain-containing protein [Candidatus Micrarchaeota archaeon]|nr:SRPBCC domain-containing protein [Candidatus Micrarchaeota archaeon]
METKKELTITRVFDAPRDLVWKAWTDQRLVKKWWGPSGVTNPTCEWNPKPGGEIYIVMLAGKELGQAAGMKWPMKDTFKEVKPQSRLVFVGGALDDVDRASDTFIENEVTVDFEDLGGKTRMNLRVVVTKAGGPKAAAALQGMTQGWNQQIDKLGEELTRSGSWGRSAGV